MSVDAGFDFGKCNIYNFSFEQCVAASLSRKPQHIDLDGAICGVVTQHQTEMSVCHCRRAKAKAIKFR